MAGERTEQATPQRRDKARREGDVLHSRELCSAAGTLAGVLLLGFAGPNFAVLWSTSLERFLSLGAVEAWEPSAVDATLHAVNRLGLSLLAPCGLVALSVVAASLGAGVVQTGGVQIHPQLVGFRLDRVNPWTNLRALVSLRAAARMGKSMIPVALLAIFAVQRISRQSSLPPFSLARLMALGVDVYQILLAAAWLLFGWAAIDYLVEWRSREMRLRMSRQDIRDEFKESEGNPQVRGRIRNLQRQARQRRIKADVAKAAVVVTNPTHYAVALEFDFESMAAPKVLAKGRNLLAEEIKSQARWAGVPILENPPLARSLYRSVAVGEAIPVALYAAVASILAFLYRERVQRERRVREAQGEGNPRSAAVWPETSDRNSGRESGAILRGSARVGQPGKVVDAGSMTGGEMRDSTEPRESGTNATGTAESKRGGDRARPRDGKWPRRPKP